MASVFFKTMGCAANMSDSEVMEGLLKEANFIIAEDIDSAELVVINICTVKGNVKALRAVRSAIDGYKDKKIIVAGCLTKEVMTEIKKIAPRANFLSTNNIKNIITVAEKTLHGKSANILKRGNSSKINFPKIRKNPVIGIAPISSGCLGNCSYCSVRKIKGKLFSYHVKDIIQEIKKCLEDGCKEIWLTSQDTGAYGKDTKTNITKLLKEVISIEGNFFVRLGMINPNHAMEFADDLIEIYKNRKIFKFMHIPVQSASNRILKLMKRKYTVEEFKKLIKKLKAGIPNLTLSTDIICGFPTETKEEFNESLNLIKEIKPDLLHISRFRPREGTEAAKMKQTENDEVKHRSTVMTTTFSWVLVENNLKYRHWKGDVMIDEIGTENNFIGRNSNYKQFIINNDSRIKLGDIVKVRVVRANTYDLKAEIVE